MNKIAIFRGQSLLTQGAFAYLQTHLENDFQICCVNPVEPQKALEQIKNFVPDIILLEGRNLLVDGMLTPLSFFEMFPNLIILALHADSPNVQIIRSEQHKPTGYAELVSTLKSETFSHTQAI